MSSKTDSPWHGDQLQHKVAADIHQCFSRDPQLAVPSQAIALLGALAHHECYTYLHSLRVASRAWQLAAVVDSNDALLLRRAGVGGLLHDVGKISIPRRLLCKVEALTMVEIEMLRMHVELGVNLVLQYDELAEFASTIAGHHERADGRGYPGQLPLAAIPLSARIVALADAIDSMEHDRPFAARKAQSAIYDELCAGAGLQWDHPLALLAAQEFMPPNRDREDQRGHTETLDPVPSTHSPALIL